ncbi:hypothetical protein Q4574_08215 [Aliiglaciecola sp. 3_MG-2023]|uniref:hypothetical protein n=1 Tax=Aliiglaciecola sp. 3_MG-2023 TaxID=3062644 RepID=UPI0026E1DDCA|nr:hypothetical protein [Aliiglaciecola sp. 3_MG-2023]MDO6693266.1 hypothetical protein [Aliiglaciecola sp. 3_MG-2023]
MQYITALTIFLLSFTLNATTNDKFETKYSYQGYPYKILIDRSDSIKILFTEKKATINCAVEFNHGESVRKTAYLEVEKADFDNEPLASCLPRHTAKAWLKDTFE